MKGDFNIEDLMKEKLGAHEVPVRPELWSNVASQIGAAGSVGSSVVTGGLSLFSKVAIITGVAVIGTTITILTLKDNSKGNANAPKIETKENVVTSTENTPANKEDVTSLSQKSIIFSDTITEMANLKKAVVEVENPAKKITIKVDEKVEAAVDEKLGELHKRSSNTEVQSTDKVTDAVNISDNTIESRTSQANSTDKRSITPVIKKVEERIQPEDNALAGSEQNYNTDDAQQLFIKQLPNVITPNGDGINDFLSVDTENINDFSVVVMNAENKIVFQSSDPDFKWFGVGMDGNPVEVGNYVYFITARKSDGNLVSRHSYLRIQR